MADGTPDLSDDLARGRHQARDKDYVLALTAHIGHNRLASSDCPG